MKKSKLLTSIAALALVVSLGACETGDIIIEVGDVNIGDDSSDTSSTESSETTPSEPEEDTSSSSSTPEEPPATYTYSLEVENGDSLTLNYDGALDEQTGVDLSIKLVTTSSAGDVTKDDATADNLTFTISDPTIVTVGGLTVTPLSGGETSITVKWSEHDEATASVGVTVTDVTVYGPTSWADYITDPYDLGVIAGAFGDVSLDEILPFSYELLTNSSYSFQSYYVSAESFRLMYSWPSDSNGLTNAWDTLLTDFGYVKVSSETSGVYTTVTYTLDGGYKIEIKYSSVGDWDLYLYPPEPEPETATTWNEYITNDYDRTQIANLFGSVEALDEILPFYIGDTDPDSITAATSAKGDRLIIKYNTAPSGIMDTWVSILTQDGWEQTDHTTSYNETYTFVKDGYTVELNLEFGEFDLYLYPKAEEEDTGLETAQAILNAAAAQTNGFQDFEYVNVQARYSNGGGGAYEHYNFDLTTDNSNLFGREIRHDEDGDDETKFRTRYYYEKYYYDINNTSGANTHSGPTSNSYNGVNRVLGWRLTSSRNYDAAFDNASSIVLADATDFELTTEANGNYKLTFVYNNTWYCYKATADCKLVGAGSAINWTSSSSYEIYYGEEESEETFNALMEPFFDDEYWFPKESSEEEIASDILKAVQGTTPNWTAFYGNAEDTWGGELTSYLALDANGALYGYIDSDDWDDETYTYYFYNGYRCMYNTYDAAQEPKEITTTFEEELELYIAGLSVSFNLATDSYELSEVNDGYSLEITHSNVKYTFIVDASYNLLSLEREQVLGSSSDYVDWSYVEGLDFEDVEYALSETNFDPDDFFGEQGGEQGGAGSQEEGLTLSDYISALSDKGFNYGDGFYFCQQSLDMSSGLDYDSLEIEALSNDVGYASQGHYDIGSGYYASEFYSDGTTTYVYDTDDQEAADAGGLYGYWFYQYTLESYFDLDTIVEQLNSLGEDADLTDSDNVITDDYLYLYAYSADYSAMVELFATYDESGITYLVYSYGTNTSSYAVEFYPTETVTAPEWYVPTTGSGTLADLFNAALDEKNYTIVLEITDYQSNETAYDPNAFSPYVQLEPLQDLWCKITYTTDAAVVEYYANYEEFLAGTVMDVEYYLNTDSGLDVFMVFDWYDVDTVYYQWTEEGLTWQDYLGSLFGLEDYFSNFVEGETTTTERGTEVSYTLDNLDSDFLEALINALVDNGNYWAWETHGVEQILFEGADVSYTVTYLEDSGIIEFVFVSDEYTYYDADNYCYYLEQTTIKVYVLDAGSSSAPDYTLEYNW